MNPALGAEAAMGVSVMRITFVLASADMSGGCKIIATYMRELAARGHDVLAVAPAPSRPPLRRRVRALVQGDLGTAFPAPHGSHLELFGVPHRYLESARPVRATDVPDSDVLVATWWETAEWIATFPATKGARAYFVQGYESDLGGDPERVLRTWELPFTKITVSSWLVGLIEQRAPGHPVYLIPNTIDRAQFDAPPRGKQARPTVGVSYSPIELKGFSVARRAIERLQQELPDLRVVSFGHEWPIPQEPLPKGTEFTRRPAQDAIRNIYGSCDVWLSTSRAEGFGLPALEAMACRCPLVSTRYGGPIDFIRNGENGYLVDVGDDEALAQRALELLRAPEDAWRTVSDAAYASAHQHTWADLAVQIEAALLDATRKTRS